MKEKKKTQKEKERSFLGNAALSSLSYSKVPAAQQFS